MKFAFLSTLILALSMSAGFAQQPAQCRNFEATIALQMTKEGCSSQIDLCTVGTVLSNEPALSGAAWLFTAHGGNFHDHHCWPVRHRVAGLQPTG